MMQADLAAYLAPLTVLAEETAVWGNGRLPLQITYYQTNQYPPLAYVASARAVLFHEGRVMVVRDRQDSYHVVPGGRREDGETILQTLQREMLEETGWTVAQPKLMASVHFRHLSPKLDDYPYPHPDFLHLVFIAQASEYKPEAITEGEYELETGFRSIAEAESLPLSVSQRALLRCGLKSRS
ncbi:MAG: NUDIX hydrolase [Chloroflexi bacterium]|nr:NUDIX hydrolase [Chloroflexota bacterium]